MMNSKENYNKIISFFIVLIASTIVFRTVCTLLIILFTIYNLVHFKYLKWPNNVWKYVCLLSLPLIFEILFFWNNSSVTLGFKSLEKYASLFVFSFFILGNYQQLSFFKILNQYRYLFTFIWVVLLLRFLVFDYDLVHKYINGIHLAEMGYKFAESFGNHAPAINMHVAFLVITNVYFLLRKRTFKNLSINIFLLLVSLFSLLVLNTRISLAVAILCSLIVSLQYFINQFKTSKIVKLSIGFVAIISGILFISFESNPYMKEKYSSVTFAYMDKVGKLDEIPNPEVVVFNAFVTRLSIWKSSYELALEQPLIGYGSADGKREVVDYFKRTNQQFLTKYAFPVHNQILDFFVKFGFLGAIMGIVYMLVPIVIGFKSKNVILFCFGIIFFISNLFDDFLIRFDGIVFFGIWICLGTAFYLRNKNSRKSELLD